MTSDFQVHRADGYEQLMGRWSKRLAMPFIDFAGVADGERILDVGCGTGSLTFALARAAAPERIVGIDASPVFVESATSHNDDGRIEFQQADATDLPFDDAAFDRALALLVLHFVPEAGDAVAEMRRVVTAGGVVAAAVWDHQGGMPGMRMMIDTAAALGDAGRELRTRWCAHELMRPGALERVFVDQGLADVATTELTIRMDYADFADYWAPIRAGEGPFSDFMATVDATELERVEGAVRDAYEAGRPDGPRSFASTAWACRGAVA